MNLLNDSTRQVYLSGQWVGQADAKISIFDSAVMLGDCVTESTRTFRHQPFRLDDHIARLYRSLKVARIDPGHSPAELKRITLNVLEANEPAMSPEDDCWIVHNISRGILWLCRREQGRQYLCRHQRKAAHTNNRELPGRNQSPNSIGTCLRNRSSKRRIEAADV